MTHTHTFGQLFVIFVSKVVIFGVILSFYKREKMGQHFHKYFRLEGAMPPLSVSPTEDFSGFFWSPSDGDIVADILMLIC